MELRFHTRALRDYWTDPSIGEFSAMEIEIGKRILAEFAAASSFQELEFLYEFTYDAGEISIVADGILVAHCRIDEHQVTDPETPPDLSRVTRVQVVSMNKIGGAS